MTHPNHNERAVFRIGGRTENLTEKMLWHGTRTTDPKLIYNGKYGFNTNYSEDGMWGRGSYFAQNASYSHMYSHKFQDGTRGMFYAKVNLGKAKELAYDE